MKIRLPRFSIYLCVLLFVTGVVAQESSSPSANLALTPPMGWNSWNKFACNVSEDLIKGMADAVVKSGMKDAGYEYVNIDDCWQVSRDRSEEHTSELQSLRHLVCRLLLEKKKHPTSTSRCASIAISVWLRAPPPETM